MSQEISEYYVQVFYLCWWPDLQHASEEGTPSSAIEQGQLKTVYHK